MFKMPLFKRITILFYYQSNYNIATLVYSRSPFELIEFEPVTISDGQPAQKAVYSFTGEDGEVVNDIHSRFKPI